MKLVDRIATTLLTAIISCQAIAEETAGDRNAFREKFIPSNAGPWDHFVLHVLGNQAVVELFLIYSFGFFVVAIEFILLKKAKATSEEILRVLAITLIVVLSITVVNSAGGRAEFTPIIGLFGTIVGYMLGSSRSSQRSEDIDSSAARKSGESEDTGRKSAEQRSGGTP